MVPTWFAGLWRWCANRPMHTLCGFLSLDPNRPLPRMVEPAAAPVNTALSQQLTQYVKKDRRRVWLKEANGHFDENDSLMPFTMRCVYRFRRKAPRRGAACLQNLTVLHRRQVQFCEMVAGFAGSHLALLRHCRTLEAENTRLRSQTIAFDNFIGDSPGMQQLRQQIAKVATCPSTVLIHGETGAGKELVAQACTSRATARMGPSWWSTVVPSAHVAGIGTFWPRRRGVHRGWQRAPGVFSTGGQRHALSG